MDNDQGASVPDQALVASDGAPSGLHPSGFDPSRGADNILPLLTDDQRAFIMRMRPHNRDQHLAAKDWRTIRPKVDNPDEDAWPWWHWFGGMKSESDAGQTGWKRTFRFNPDGLAVRARLAAAMKEQG